MSLESIQYYPVSINPPTRKEAFHSYAFRIHSLQYLVALTTLAALIRKNQSRLPGPMLVTAAAERARSGRASPLAPGRAGSSILRRERLCQ